MACAFCSSREGLQFRVLKPLHGDPKYGGLSGEVLRLIILREGHIDRNMVAHRSANQLLLKAGDKRAGAKGQGIVGTGAAVKGNAVQITGEVDHCNVTQLSGAVNAPVYGVLGGGCVNGGLLFRLGQLRAGASCVDTLILPQLDFRTKGKFHLEFQPIRFVGLKYGDDRLGGNGQAGFGNGLRIMLGKDVLYGLPQQILGSGIRCDVGTCYRKVLVGFGVFRIDLIQRLAQNIARGKVT